MTWSGEVWRTRDLKQKDGGGGSGGRWIEELRSRWIATFRVGRPSSASVGSAS